MSNSSNSRISFIYTFGKFPAIFGLEEAKLSLISLDTFTFSAVHPLVTLV